jgi:hypothetical protein
VAKKTIRIRTPTAVALNERLATALAEIEELKKTNALYANIIKTKEKSTLQLCSLQEQIDAFHLQEIEKLRNENINLKIRMARYRCG